MKTPGRRALSDSRSPTRYRANTSAKIDADIAITFYRAKLKKVTSRDRNAAALATEHGITQKAVRDVWNLRTWAAATRPFWNAEDREKWARIHAKQAPSVAQSAPAAHEHQKLSSPWHPRLQDPPPYLTPAGMLVMGDEPSRPEGEQMRTCSSEARRAMMMAAARWQPFKVAKWHHLDWLQNPELGYDASAFERRTYHAGLPERGRSFAPGTARCRQGPFPPAGVLGGVNDDGRRDHEGLHGRPAAAGYPPHAHQAAAGYLQRAAYNQGAEGYPSHAYQAEAGYPPHAAHPSMCFLDGTAFGDSQCSMASNATTVDLADSSQDVAWLQVDPAASEDVGLRGPGMAFTCGRAPLDCGWALSGDLAGKRQLDGDGGAALPGAILGADVGSERGGGGMGVGGGGVGGGGGGEGRGGEGRDVFALGEHHGGAGRYEQGDAKQQVTASNGSGRYEELRWFLDQID